MKLNNFCFSFTMLLAATLCSCSPNERTNMDGASKEEIKAVNEYRDSGRWGKAVSRVYEVGEFDAFQAMGNVEVVYRQADECSVKTIGHAEAIEQYELKIENGNYNNLVVKLKDDADDRYDNIPSITVLITSPKLRCVMVSGGDVELKGELQQKDSLTIYVEGNGDVYAKNINVNALSIEVSGNGDVELKKANVRSDARAIVNGNGDIEGKLKCSNALIEVNGSGSVDMDIKCQELTAYCNGKGDIELKGKCRTLRKRNSINGHIDSHNLSVEKDILIDK